ncbi:DUF177 domain-containing protein [Puteibacter caeruleilacunae]|nr:DUF177 domain-containing protein [Puteibacter caeruleilacunae]
MAMETIKDFTIPFKGLKEGKHEFKFTAGNRFFEAFEGSEIEKGDVSVSITMEKRTTFIQFNFHIEGFVNILCDRCLDTYDQALDNDFKLIVKFAEEESDEGDDIVYISSSEHQINVSHYIYEYIMLSIPIQRIHPEDEHGNSTCNQEMLNKLDEYTVREEEKETDNRWDELKKLLDNK